MDRFELKLPCPGDNVSKQPIVRLKPAYYQILTALKTKYGLPMGNITEQCIDFALAHMVEDDDNADA